MMSGNTTMHEELEKIIAGFYKVTLKDAMPLQSHTRVS